MIYALLALAAALLTPPAGAHTVALSLRDLGGRGVAGASVVVRDEAGVSDLAAATTGPDGRAELAVGQGGAVRVAVVGALADGTPLVQRGLDARGIWLLVDTPRVALDLRVEAGGAVVPDPSMISPDLPPETAADSTGAAAAATLSPEPSPTATPTTASTAPGGSQVLGVLALALALALGALAAWRQGGAR